MAQITGVVTDGAGSVVVGMPVAIYTSGSMAPAVLYYDSGFTKTRPNPVYTDLTGTYGGVKDPIFINASTYEVVYFPQRFEGMELAPGIAGPLINDTGGSVPPEEWAFAWTAGGSVTTSYASLFADSQRTVVAGMRFLVTGWATVTNGGTAGFVKYGIQAAAGDTAVVAFNAVAGSINTVLQAQENIAISAVMSHPLMGVMTVITGGTLTLSMFGQTSGSTGSIAANGAGVYVRRLN